MAKGKGTLSTLDIKDIDFDPDFQSRHDLHSPAEIEDFAELIKAEKLDVERLKVCYVKALDKHICVDGHKRGASLLKAGRKTAGVLIYKVSLFEARIMAAVANRGQDAKERTRADKRRAVEMYLDALVESSNPGRPSARNIANEIGGGVSDFLVRTMMKERELEAGEKPEKIPVEADEDEAPKKKKTEPVASTDSDDWRSVPLREFLDADPYIWDAIDSFKILTAGDLYERLFTRKEKLGLTITDVEDLKKQMERMKEAAEVFGEKPAPKEKPKRQGEEKGFNFREFDSAFGIVARGPDELVKQYTRWHRSPQYNVLISQLTEFKKTWDDLVKRATGAER